MWWALAVLVLLVAYGIVERIAHSKLSIWVWVTAALLVMLAVVLWISVGTRRERDDALTERDEALARIGALEEEPRGVSVAINIHGDPHINLPGRQLPE